MVFACKCRVACCRVACCQVLDSAVLAFKLDKCWKEAGFRPILDGQQVGLRLLLCYTEHWLLGKAKQHGVIKSTHGKVSAWKH